MKKWKFQLGLLVIALCAIVFTNQAQDKKEKFKAMHQEMRQYAENNILPILKEQRAKLDAQLSDTEKATLTEVRDQLHQQREAMHKEMKAARQAMKDGEKLDREEMHKKFKAMKAKKDEIIAPAKEILEKHQANIEQLLADERIDKEGWKNEMDAIRKKYISEEEMEEMKKKHHGKKRHRFHDKEGEKHHKDGEMRGKHHGHHKGMKRMHHGRMMHKNMKPMGFLLWDANAPLPSPGEEETPVDFGVYPNPTTSQNTIGFNVAKKGQVKIELLDKQGNVLKTVLNDTKDAGAYTIDVGLDTLPNAVYYYRVTTATGSKTKRFVLNK